MNGFQMFAGGMGSAKQSSKGTRQSTVVWNHQIARKLKALESENAKLKKLLAEQMLDNAMLRDVNSKKW